MSADTKTFHPLHDTDKGIIDLYSGRKLDLKAPRPDMFTLLDVANGCSKECRFGNQLGPFYSVALHQMLVYWLCDPLATDEEKRACLLHDASEGLVWKDIATPAKKMLGEAYYAPERLLMAAVGLKWDVRPDSFAAIKPYDKLAVEIEHSAIRAMDSLHEVLFNRFLNSFGWTKIPADMDEVMRVYTRVCNDNRIF